LATEFRSEKIPRNRLGMGSLIPRKKVLIPRFTEESITRFGTEGNGMKKISFTKNPAPANRIDSMFSSEPGLGMEFREFSSIFVPRNGIPSCFLFRGIVQNGIPRVCFYFCSIVQNSEHFSPLQNGSERNSESFLFRGTAGIPPEQTNCSVYSVFRGIIFLLEISNPIDEPVVHLCHIWFL
jgi:hypothetical protein